MASLNYKEDIFQDPIIVNALQQFKDISITKAFSRNSIVVTENKNRVYLFQIHDRKILNEWRLSALHSLSSEAVQHPDKSHFSAILDKFNLRTWDINDATMHHKTNNIKLLKPGHGLISLTNGTLIIIYKDGSLGCATDIQSNWKPDNIIAEDVILVKDYTHSYVDDHYLVKLLIADDIDRNYIIEYKIKDDASGLQVTSTINLLEKPSFEYLNAGLRLAENFVSVSLDDQQYVVSGPLPNSDDLQCYFYIMDNNFGLMRSQMPHNTTGILKLLRVEESIIVVSLSGIYEITLNYQPSNLLSCLIHKQEERKDEEINVDDPNIYLQFLCDTNKCDLSDRLKNWINHISKLELCQRILIRSQVDTVILNLAENPESEDYYWSKDVDLFIKIIQTGLVTSSCCDCLIDLAEKTQNLDLLIAIIKFIPNISERNIVDMLSIIMQRSTTDECTHAHSSLLNLLLRLPFTKDDMVSCLKDIQFNCLLTFLNILYKSLTRDDVTDDDVTSDKDTIDGDVYLIEWLSMLLDASYTKLILHSDCQVLVDHIRSYIQQRIDDAKKRVFMNFNETVIVYQRRLKTKLRKKYVIHSLIY